MWFYLLSNFSNSELFIQFYFPIATVSSPRKSAMDIVSNEKGSHHQNALEVQKYEQSAQIAQNELFLRRVSKIYIEAVAKEKEDFFANSVALIFSLNLCKVLFFWRRTQFSALCYLLGLSLLTSSAYATSHGLLYLYCRYRSP